MSTPKETGLDVWVNDRRIGKLSLTDAHEYRFKYLDDVPEEDAVSLTLPVALKTCDTQVLHPVFQQNLPEGALLEFVQQAIRKSEARDLYDVIADDLVVLYHTGVNQIGRIRVTPPGSEPQAPGSVIHHSLDEAVEDDRDDIIGEYLSQYGLTSGVSGIQPKVLADLENERLTLGFGRYLVKFEGTREHFGICVNEFFCLRAACHAGLRVPAARLSDDGTRLVVPRFDFVPKTGQHLGFEETCALAGLPSTAKYNGDYRDVAELMLRNVSARHRPETRRELFTSILLSMAVENGDAHLKNFGALYEHAGTGCQVRMAPVYDVVTTTAYIPSDKPALSFLGEKDWPSRERMIEFGKRLGLTKKDITATIANIDQALRQALTDLKAYCEGHDRYQPVYDALAKRWSRGLNRLHGKPVDLELDRAGAQPTEDPVACKPQP